MPVARHLARNFPKHASSARAIDGKGRSTNSNGRAAGIITKEMVLHRGREELGR